MTNKKQTLNRQGIDELHGNWSVYRISGSGKELLESDLPEEIARDMVADYASEGVECVMEKIDD